MFKYLIGGIFLLTVNPAFAEECDYNQAQGSITQCVYEKYMVADKELNRTYQTLYRKIGSNKFDEFALEHQKDLKKAQLAWIKFRDLDCIYDAQLTGGGTMNQMFYNHCLMKRTQERTAMLKEFISKL